MYNHSSRRIFSFLFCSMFLDYLRISITWAPCRRKLPGAASTTARGKPCARIPCCNHQTSICLAACGYFPVPYLRICFFMEARGEQCARNPCCTSKISISYFLVIFYVYVYLFCHNCKFLYQVEGQASCEFLQKAMNAKRC